jgi:polyhydroxyalkanoate synthesis regulator phasin
MNNIDNDILRQYTNFDYNDLNQDFDSNQLQNKDKKSTFNQNRDLSLENLKRQYVYYLRRYESAYGQLMVNKSPVLINNQNQDKINDLENTVSKLNNKLKQIVDALIKNNNINKEDIQNLSKDNSKNQYTISYKANKLETQNSLMSNKFQNLTSESQMMKYSEQMNRSKNIYIVIYSILSILAIIVFIILFSQLSKK